MRRDPIHELRLLLVLSGHAELLLDAAEPDSAAHRHAEEIVAAARELERLLGTAVHDATVLVVDDDDGVRSLVHDVLESSGYTVLRATDREAAAVVAGAYGATIDLLVIDTVTRRPAGRALIEQLASANPRLRVLLMSGGDEPQLDGAALLKKPFTLDELTGAVRSLLDR